MKCCQHCLIWFGIKSIFLLIGGRVLWLIIFKRKDREDPGNYRNIALLSLIAKLYSRVINNHLLKCLELNDNLHEGRECPWCHS